MEGIEYGFLYAARAPVHPRDTVPYAFGVFLEEGLEMTGVLVALWAVLSALVVTTGEQGLRVEYRQVALSGA